MTLIEGVIGRVLAENPGFDPADRRLGGVCAQWGISLELLRRLRAQASQRILQSLSEEEARALYRQLLIDSNLALLRDAELLYWVLDAVRQHGPQIAIRLLMLAGQRSANGALTPADVEAINARPASRVLRRLQVLRLHLLAQSAANHPETIGYLPAWVDRLAEVLV